MYKKTGEYFFLEKKRELNPFEYSENYRKMEVIDKRHEDIHFNERTDLAAFVRFEEKMVYFSAGAKKLYGIKSPLTVHFINEGNDWSFYVDTDKDGFPLVERVGKNASLLMSTHLVSLFVKRTLVSLPCKFPITLTKALYNNCPIFKIEINKPMEL